MGGGELARAFLKDDLVDELVLGVVPILLGNGMPLFPAAFPQRDFVLIENKTYFEEPDLLRYRRFIRRGKANEEFTLAGPDSFRSRLRARQRALRLHHRHTIRFHRRSDRQQCHPGEEHRVRD